MIDEKPYYLFGRNIDLTDFCIDHASCSRVHAALVYHKHLDRFFLTDLKSSNKNFKIFLFIIIIFCNLYFNQRNSVCLFSLFIAHGSFIGNIRMESEKPTQLPLDSTFQFGASTRVYTLRKKSTNSKEDSMENIEEASLCLPEYELDVSLYFILFLFFIN